MKKIKNFTAYAIMLLSVTSFSSCADWLDVHPSNETAASVLFSSERGFQEALTGVYTLMTAEKLYGRELTFGMVDVIGQQYAPHTTDFSNYYYCKYFIYDQGASITLCDNIWNNQFNAIANINDLLAYIDVNQNVFSSERVRSIIKGEALALRAFLHFDILRLYVPYDADRSSTQKIMPYVEIFSKNTAISLTYSEVVAKIEADLVSAKELLKVDPILTGETLGDLYFKNRNLHMNYYATVGIMARLYMYIGEKTEAFECADEIIQAQNTKGVFPFVSSIDATNADTKRRDRTFSPEHLFTLEVRDLEQTLKGLMYQVSIESGLFPAMGSQVLYEGLADYRKAFFETESGKQDVPSKFWQVDPTKKFVHKMPIIRISEMYYIAAECEQKASYLNTVRRARNITTDLDQALSGQQLDEEILKEYDKEFFGEGQVFFYHKRKGSESIRYSPPPVYELIMPQTEIDFGGRPRPETPKQ